VKLLPSSERSSCYLDFKITRICVNWREQVSLSYLEVQAGINELFTSKYRPFCDPISYGKLNLNLDVASCGLVSVFDE
jgi:hypothetical protein